MHVDGEENIESAPAADGTKFTVGDFVFVKNSRTDGETKPLVLLVTRMWKENDGSQWCR